MKSKGQFFTPPFIVNKILDEVNFFENGLKKSILDPACGDGRFLVEIAKRVIKYSPPNQLKRNLEYIEGWDIDENVIKLAKENLDKLIRPLNIKVSWNLKVRDSLKIENNLFENYRYHYIVGNPPYIRIQNLPEESRKFFKKKFKLFVGNSDIFILFFELIFDILDKDGICGLITPNSYFSTESAKLLRKEFEERKNIIKIINYHSLPIFKDASTYTAITIFDKKERDSFIYQKAIDFDKFETKTIKYKQLTPPFWQFHKSKKGTKLKEICDINIGIQTLADKVYISKFEKEDSNFIYLKTKYKGIVKFEKEILKPIVKVSTLKKWEKKVNEYIIFPYINGDILDENLFIEKYPLTYEYLRSLKEILDNRDKGKKQYPKWYAFGRNVSIKNSFQKKIVFSPMNRYPNFIYIPEEVTFYSGYSLRPKIEIDINYLLSQLNSERMAKFIEANGRDLRGGWKTYSKKVIGEFDIII